MRADKNIFENIDKISITLYIILIFFGWINIYASQYNEDSKLILDLSTRYGKQLLFIAVALVIAIINLIIDWKFYYSLSYLLYIVIIIMLIGVLFSGNIVGGAKSWFNLGIFKFQPSEFAKFATALALAKYYNNIYIKKISFTEKIKTYIIILIPFLLIIAQNDLGTALIYS